MDLLEINLKKEENKMDIQSPYIKNGTDSIDEVRKRISKRALHKDEHEHKGKVLSLKNESCKIESDDVLKQKISSVSKRVVGEEIKKFAEIASREIAKELEEIEARIEANLKSDINNLQNEIDKKIEKFNYNIKDLESRVRDLEILSIGISPKSFEEKKTKHVENSNNIKSDKDLIENDLEKKIINEKQEKGNNDVKTYYTSVALREEEDKYINERLKEISSLFEKTGLLFRKNSYVSKIRDLNVEEFLNNRDSSDYKNIDSNDKEKISKIITDFMDTLEIDPKEDEKIEEFLKRIHRTDFQNKKLNKV
ncbi:MAG: hypothetical protein KBD12_00520 [Candidatus Pacebacteria bacterium]|nr:hypothetical protein [Candidatus Paceibacterota bacterium]